MRAQPFALALALGACLSTGAGLSAQARPSAKEPADPAPLPIPAAWPAGEAYVLAQDAALPAYSYREVLADPRLVRLVDLALAHNQDLALALSNVEAATAQLRVQRAAFFPSWMSQQTISGAGAMGAGRTGLTLDRAISSICKALPLPMSWMCSGGSAG